MKPSALLLGMLLAGALGAPSASPAQEVYREKPASCEPGFAYVQDVEYREVERPVCKEVPIIRKKWVYCVRPDYFCLPACPLLGLWHHDGCGPCQACDTCEGPYGRQKLLKKQVEWACGTRCVVEVVKEKVPCVVWRKVPCGPAFVPSPSAGGGAAPR